MTLGLIIYGFDIPSVNVAHENVTDCPLINKKFEAIPIWKLGDL